MAGNDIERPVSALDAETLRKAVRHVAAEAMGRTVESMVCLVKLQGLADVVISDGLPTGAVAPWLREHADKVERKLQENEVDRNGGDRSFMKKADDDDGEGSGSA